MLIRRWSAESRQLASHMQHRRQRQASAAPACRAVATAQRPVRTEICRASAAAPPAQRTMLAPPCSTTLQTSLM